MATNLCMHGFFLFFNSKAFFKNHGKIVLSKYLNFNEVKIIYKPNNKIIALKLFQIL